MVREVSVVVLLFATTLAGQTHAHDRTRARAQVVEAPKECDEDDALRSIRGALAANTGSTPEVPREVRIVRVGQGGHGLRVSIAGAAADSTKRTLLVSSCAQAARAIETVMALSAREDAPDPSPEVLSRADDPTEPSAAEGTGVTMGQGRFGNDDESTRNVATLPRETSPSAAAPRATSAARRDDTRLGLYALGAVDTGTLPSTSLGGRAGAGVARGRFSGSLGAAFFPAQESTGAEPGVSVELLAAEANACGVVFDARVDLSLCAGAELGRTSAVGLALTDARRDRSLWAAVHAGPKLALSLGGDAKIVGAFQAVVPITRRAFHADGTGRELHRPSAVAARAVVGLEVELR